MKLTFVRKPAFRGDIVVKRGISVQFFENSEGIDYLKVTSDSPRQVIEVPVSMVTTALESQWTRDTGERSSRFATAKESSRLAKQQQQFQNKVYE